MHRTTRCHRFLIAALSVSAVLLLVAAGILHRHDGPGASHSAQSCAVCRMQSRCFATPVMPSEVHRPLVFAGQQPLDRHTCPPVICVVRLSVPRGPPQRS